MANIYGDTFELVFGEKLVMQKSADATDIDQANDVVANVAN